MAKPGPRKALGRGLLTLIPEESDERGSENNVVFVDVKALTPNPFQPRTEFDDEEIAGLAESIRAQGLLQPLVVRKKGDGYEVASGERRLRALKSLGNDKIPCIVRPGVSDREMLEIALVENLQRANLNEIEKAQAYQKHLLEWSLSHEELAARLGTSRSVITNTLRLLKLPTAIQRMLRGGELSMGHARALLSLDDPPAQRELAKRIVAQQLSVREVESLIQKMGADRVGKKKKARKSPATPSGLGPDLADAVERVRYRFGTKIRLTGTAESEGKIEIFYHGKEDLSRVLQLLLG